MSDDAPPSFASRALLAFAFVWSFRLLVFGVAAAWVSLPSWLPDSVPFPLRALAYVLAGVTAVLALRSLVFIPDNFTPPSPPVGPAAHPALRALVDEVARELHTPPPTDIYLLPDVNAYVRETGGVLGFGMRRTLMLGVGLLAISTVSELRATLAHELAHFVGGDTRLSLSLARTRQGVLVVLEQLHGGLLFRPFAIYAALFLSLTQQMARAQELWADRAAVRIAGREPQERSLTRAVVGDVLTRRMLQRGLPFLLGVGLAPRNAYAVLRAAERAELEDDARLEVEKELAEKPTDAFDSHPSHDERIRYAASLPERAGRARDDRPAAVLLDDADAIEVQNTRIVIGHLHSGAVTFVDETDLLASAVRPTFARLAEAARARASELLGGEAGSDDQHALLALLEMAARSEARGDDVPLTRERALANAVRDALAQGVAALLAHVWQDLGGELRFNGVELPEVDLDGERLSPFPEAARAMNAPDAAAALLARTKARLTAG